MTKQTPLACALLAGLSAAHAQDMQASSRTAAYTLAPVIVTARKVAQNLQNVPMSVEAITASALTQLHVNSFDDYLKLVPSMSTQTEGPGLSRVYIRGVSTEYNQSHSGPLPTVATYLDEQPVTTVQGTLDVHMYDIRRVEVLEGPQGTLYGASSEAGTVRIITNKPDPHAFEGGFELDGNAVDHGGKGYDAEGFVNIPISPVAAVRLVGWSEHDGGYINNVPGRLDFTTSTGSTICLENTSPPTPGCTSTPALARDHFNTVQTNGGRAALEILLGDSWTVTPTVMAQRTHTEGTFAYNPMLGDLNVSRFYPDNSRDNWWDTALTIEGKISNFDLVYSGAFLKRGEALQQDYVDYSVAYDNPVPAYMIDYSGNPANPSMTENLRYDYSNQTHELRLLSPRDRRLRFVAGVFWQRQLEDINEHYDIDDLAPALTFASFPHTWFLLDQVRIDRNEALFGELSYDLAPRLTVTGGMRFFKYKNTNNGFVGFSAAGEQAVETNLGSAQFGALECFEPGINGAPCTNVDKGVDESGHTPMVNVSYRLDTNMMVYARWAVGFRPGGINRRPELPPFKADYLHSYEVGWKATWLDHRLRDNGAVFWEDWSDFQFSFVGQNGLSVFANGGQARIKGIENSTDWAATPRLTLSAGVTWLHPVLSKPYCGTLDANGNPITSCANPLSPAGTQLAGTPKFKGDFTGRYRWNLGSLAGHLQWLYSYQTSVYADTRLRERGLLGKQSPYGTLDLFAGIDRDSYSVELYVDNATDKRGQLTRYSECAAATCAPIATYVLPNRPRTIGIRYDQDF